MGDSPLLEIIHLGLGEFRAQFSDASSIRTFRKQPNILLERTPTSKYLDDGENDSDMRISSLSIAYEQMYCPRFSFFKLWMARN